MPIFTQALSGALIMLNRTELIGRLGHDPELRYTAEGKAIANLSMATTHRSKDPAGGDTIENTQWHRVVFFGRKAEIAGEYLKKGALAYVDGRLQSRQWIDAEGEQHTVIEILGDSLTFLERRQENSLGPANETLGPDIPF
ncbi:MAG: single-stranded DNA-binding protein [Methylococcus sp.]|jgi:single-strand DNA-binding protein|nr:MAG: single-stranded DNA-binding protein [Methylococcus sp.]